MNDFRGTESASGPSHGTNRDRKRPCIFHVITSLYTGGSEAMLARLMDGYDKRAFEHVVICLRDEGHFGARIRQAGVELRCLNMTKGIHFIAGMLTLIRLLLAKRPAVVETWLYHADFLGLVLKRLGFVKKLVWNIRCSDPDLKQYSPVTRGIFRVLVSQSHVPDIVNCNSVKGRESHAALGYKPRAWRIIPNGFESGKFFPDKARGQAMRRSLGIPEGMTVIGMMARYDPAKDFVNLARAAAILGRSSQVTFILAGAGIEHGNAKLVSSLAAEGVADRFHLIGRQTDVIGFYNLCDVFVLSSFTEGFPNVVGEAMLCGVPVVATAVGDVPLIVEEAENVVPVGDSSKLAQALARCLDLPADERIRRGMEGRAKIESRYGIGTIVHSYETMFRELTTT